MGQFATGLATKSRLRSQLRFRERGQTFGKLKRKDTGKYDKKKNRMESESDDRRQNTKPKFTYFSEEGRKKVSKLVGCWCERVEVS